MANPMQLPDKYQALAAEIFHDMGVKCTAAGIAPDDPLLGKLAATVLAGTYMVRGGGAALKAEILKMVGDYIDAVENAEPPSFFGH